MTQPMNITEGSILKSLRALMPLRQLSLAEARQIAERQANRLLALHGIPGPAVPAEIITELPRVRVERAYDIPVSGSALWDGNYWVMTLNASESELRQRFSLMHEFKHILDHPFRHLMQRSAPAPEKSLEYIADYFAACVLMPKRWVKTAFFSETQSTEALADKFQVSRQAMSYRLHELGLVEPAPRCRSPWLQCHFTRPRVPSQSGRVGPPLTGVRT